MPFYVQTHCFMFTVSLFTLTSRWYAGKSWSLYSWSIPACKCKDASRPKWAQSLASWHEDLSQFCERALGGNRGEILSVTSVSHMLLKQIIYVLASSKMSSSILVLWVVRMLFHANTLRFIGCFWFLHSLVWKIVSLKVHSKYFNVWSNNNGASAKYSHSSNFGLFVVKWDMLLDLTTTYGLPPHYEEMSHKHTHTKAMSLARLVCHYIWSECISAYTRVWKAVFMRRHHHIPTWWRLHVHPRLSTRTTCAHRPSLDLNVTEENKMAHYGCSEERQYLLYGSDSFERCSTHKQKEHPRLLTAPACVPFDWWAPSQMFFSPNQ